MRATAQPRPFTLSTTHKQLCAWLSTPRAHQAGSRQGQHCQTARTVAMAAVAEPETASSRLEVLHMPLPFCTITHRQGACCRAVRLL